MKKSIVIIFIVLCSLLSANELVKNIDFSINDLSFTKQDSYDCVVIQETKHNFEVGRPNLPVKVINLIIPTDAEVQDLQIISKPVEIPGNYKIVPVQKPLSFDQEIEIEPMTLDSSRIYPQKIATISNIGYFAGNKIVSILVYPLQYLPEQEKLMLNKNIQLKIIYQNTATNGVIKQRGFTEYNNKIEKTLKLFIDNPERIPIQPKKDLTEIVKAKKFIPKDIPSP